MLLNTEQVASILGYTKEYTSRLFKSNKLPAFKPNGGAWRMRKDDLEAFIKYKSTTPELIEIKKRR